MKNFHVRSIDKAISLAHAYWKCKGHGKVYILEDHSLSRTKNDGAILVIRPQYDYRRSEFRLITELL